jgi:hypothetical protein
MCGLRIPLLECSMKAETESWGTYEYKGNAFFLFVTKLHKNIPFFLQLIFLSFYETYIHLVFH